MATKNLIYFHSLNKKKHCYLCSKLWEVRLVALPHWNSSAPSSQSFCPSHSHTLEMQLPLGQAKWPSSHFCPWETGDEQQNPAGVSPPGINQWLRSLSSPKLSENLWFRRHNHLWKWDPSKSFLIEACSFNLPANAHAEMLFFVSACVCICAERCSPWQLVSSA